MRKTQEKLTRPRWRDRVRAAFAVAIGASMLGACTSFADFLTPGQRGDNSSPAMITLQAVVPRLNDTPAEVVTLNVVASYLRRDGSEVRLGGGQTLSLSSAEVQAVPIGIDVATCLADPERAGGTGSCSVTLMLALTVNGVVVDRQTVGPLNLTPGQPADVAQPVTLFAITSLAVVDANGAPIPADAPINIPLGESRSLRARILDNRAQVVTDRAVTWTSDAPQVATISAAGAITSVGVGTARFTATLGTLSASVSSSITRPPAALAIVGAVGSGRGTVRSNPVGIDCRVNESAVTGACTFTFPGDAAVTLTSTPDDGNLFGAWGEACSAALSGGTCLVTMSIARQASARFTALRRFSLRASTGKDGRGRITGSNGLDCRINGGTTSGTCTVQVVDGSTITLAASPEPLAVGGGESRQRFAGWDDACVSSTGGTCAVTLVGGDRIASAGFFDERRLAVDIVGTGGGRVESAQLVECMRAASVTSGACEALLMHGASVTLQAIPDAQSAFAGWSGACEGNGAVCALTLTASRTTTAIFTKTMQTQTQTLTLNITGTGSGTLQVNGTPACALAFAAGSAVCTQQFDAGTVVTVRGIAGGLSTFAGFSGGDCSGTADCALTMNSSRTVGASFAALPLTLTVDGYPGSTGSGAIRALAVAGGIDCTYTLGVTTAGMCSMSVNPFGPVALTAIPKPASALLAWGGACAGSPTVTCSVATSVATSVSARFVAAIDVTMNVGGSGGGVISFDIAGVPAQSTCVSTPNHAKSCAYALPVGRSGVFRGTPAPGYQFIGFSGPCVEGAGPVPVCTYLGFGFVRTIQAYFQTP